MLQCRSRRIGSSSPRTSPLPMRRRGSTTSPRSASLTSTSPPSSPRRPGRRTSTTSSTTRGSPRSSAARRASASFHGPRASTASASSPTSSPTTWPCRPPCITTRPCGRCSPRARTHPSRTGSTWIGPATTASSCPCSATASAPSSPARNSPSTTWSCPASRTTARFPSCRYYEHVFPVREGTENLPMADLVVDQPYRLAYWRVANEELNYRRFFDVGSLVAVHVENQDVFESTHRVIVDLVNDGTLQGLRIDHPDGLANPAGYIAQLVRRDQRRVARRREDPRGRGAPADLVEDGGHDGIRRLVARRRPAARPGGIGTSRRNALPAHRRRDGLASRTHRRREARDRARLACPRSLAASRRSPTTSAVPTCASATTPGTPCTTACDRCSSTSAATARTWSPAPRPSRCRSRRSTQPRPARRPCSIPSATRRSTSSSTCSRAPRSARRARPSTPPAWSS